MPEFVYDLLPDAPPADTDPEAAQAIGSGLTDADGAAANQQLAHVAKGQSRLIRYFRVGKPRIAALLAAFTEQVQSFEDVLWSYYKDSRDLDTAGGVLLERLGAAVDEPRNQRTDDQYRAAIRVKVALLSSDGKTEQLLTIGRLMVPSATVNITEHWPAAISIAFSETGDLSLSYIKAILKIGKAAGVRLDVGLPGGAIGHSDGSPTGGAIGHSDGSPIGCAIGSS